MKAFILFIFLILITQTSYASTYQFELIQQAESLKGSEDHLKTASVLEKLTKLNPLNGEYWFRLANSYSQLNQLPQSISAYEKAAKIGYEKAFALYNIAAAHALMGHSAQAMQFLLKARQHKMPDFERSLMADDDFNSIKSLAEFNQQFYPLVSNGDRQQKWLADIDFFSKRIQETHFNFTLNITKSSWESEIARIKSKIGLIDDKTIYVELQKLVAKLADGHSIIIPPFMGESQFHSMPIRFGSFADGIYIQAADKKYQALLGHRVIGINDIKIEDVLERLEKIFKGDNQFGGQYARLRIFIAIPEILQVLNIVPDSNHIRLNLLSSENNQANVIVDTAPFNPQDFSYVEQPESWLTMLKVGTDLPLWQQQPEVNFWHKMLNNDKIMYLKLNRIRNDKNQSLANYFQRVIDEAITKKAKALILDLRSNNGGNGGLNVALIQKVLSSQFNQPDRFYVLIGNKTFSAAHQLSLELSHFTQATFVGEPTGSSWVYRGESNSIMLPNSGLLMMIASRQFQGYLSDDYRESMTPDVLISMTSSDFRLGHDPVLAAIKKRLLDTTN